MDTKVLDYILRSLGPFVGQDFNDQILGLIDIALLPLLQVGALKKGIKEITASTTWNEFVSDPPTNSEYTREDILKGIQSYIYVKVKLLFDPPAASIAQVYQQVADEELWRIREVYEEYDTTEGSDTE